MPSRLVEDDWAKILWDFLVCLEVGPSVSGSHLVDKQRKAAVVVDVAIANKGNFRKKEHKELEKYQGLRE